MMCFKSVYVIFFLYRKHPFEIQNLAEFGFLFSKKKEIKNLRKRISNLSTRVREKPLIFILFEVHPTEPIIGLLFLPFQGHVFSIVNDGGILHPYRTDVDKSDQA